MSHPARRNSTHRAILFLAIAATLGITAVGLSQCRMVADNVTGLRMTPGRLSGRSSCARNCQEAFVEAMREEYRRHLAALRACGQDANCRAEENQRHDAIVDQLEDARRKCKKDCYNEGGGSGQ